MFVETAMLDGNWMRGAQMIKNFGAFLKDDSGSAAVEYGIFAAGIAASIVMALGEIGPKLYGTFAKIADELPGIIAFGP